MSIRNIRTSEIVVDAGTQVRAKIRNSAITEYAQAMRDGAEFPPVIVFHDGNHSLLADGFHRVMAAARIGRETIVAEVRQGTKSDALKFALSANVVHGLRRTNSDKRRSVDLALREWPRLSDRSIAEICSVSDRFVNEVRAQLPTANRSQLPETRIGMDGRTRRVPERRRLPVAVPHKADFIFWLQELVERADYELEGNQREQFKNELEFASREMK